MRVKEKSKNVVLSFKRKYWDYKQYFTFWTEVGMSHLEIRLK